MSDHLWLQMHDPNPITRNLAYGRWFLMVAHEMAAKGFHKHAAHHCRLAAQAFKQEKTWHS